MSKPAILNLAIIGLGSQACEHLNAARRHPSVKIVAGVDNNMARRINVEQEFADLGLQLYASVEELYEASPGLMLHGLILALPHHAYDSLWKTLLEFRLPMLKEKPLGRHYEEAQRFVAEAEAAGCLLQTAIQRRYHPCYLGLREYLVSNRLRVVEVHAHLHLGKDKRPATTKTGSASDWRRDRLRSGGGALLDAGYHLVDLVHFLTGTMDVVSATMWADEHVDDGRCNEDRAWLTGRSEHCWVMLDIWVHGVPHPEHTGNEKSEEVRLWTDQGLLRASREGVWHNDRQISRSDKSWEQAMQEQLELFAQHIRSGDWQDESIWDQLPTMRVIEESYRLSSRY